MAISKEQQKKDRAAKMRAGKIAKEEARKNQQAEQEVLIVEQKAEIEGLRVKVSEKNVENTTEFVKTNQVNPEIQSEINALKQELLDLKIILQHSGGLPKKVSSTTPWKSVGRPFHKDILKTKKQHKGFELGFIENTEDEIDNYLSNGYNIAKGENYGEKEGALKRRRLIGVERTIEAAEESRTMLREFNKMQRTSALQKTEVMADAISQASGRKTDLKLGYEIHK